MQMSPSAQFFHILKMKAECFIYALLLMLILGCQQELPTPVAPPVSTAKSYDARGLVKAVALDRRSATIKHEEIPGYMKPMTMVLDVRDTNEFAGIAPGDEITFKLRVTDDEDWIENIRFVAHRAVVDTNDLFTFQIPNQSLKPGDALGDYEFTGEDGKVFRFSDFRGSAVAFTFFFTSCPLPEFCPRMNKNFAGARKILTDDVNAPTNWQMLSISFDPELDKPGILGGYGSFYRGQNTNRWLFAVASTNTLAGLAPKVGLNFWREVGTISHNLRTVVLDGQGNIARQFDGNDWTAEELAGAVRDAAK
jgi:protein SCO1